MARKTTRRKPKTQSSATPDQTSIPDPSIDPALPSGPPPRKRGRPSKEEAEARKAEARAAAAIPVEAMIPVTSALLTLTAAFIKGDEPTQAELTSTNIALTAVVNKYGANMAYAEEIMLAVALGNAGFGMYKRGKAKRAASDSGHRGDEGLRKDGDGAIVPGLAPALGNN